LTAWVREHWLWSIFICFGIVMGTLSLFSLRYPILKEKILKRILSGFSVVVIALAYFTVFALTAIGFKALGRRLLPNPGKNKDGKTYWCKREKIEPTLDYLKRQF